MSRKFTVMLIPHRGAGTRQTMLSLWQILLAVAAAACMAALVVTAFVYSGWLRFEAKGLNEKLQQATAESQEQLQESIAASLVLSDEKARLETELEERSAQIEELENQAEQALAVLTELESREEEIYTLLGIETGKGGEGEAVVITVGGTGNTYDYIINSAGRILSMLESEETNRAIEYATDCIPDGWPLESGSFITSDYGTRLNPMTHNGYEKHSGIDIAARNGESILASGAGTVVFAGENEIYGNFIRIDHGNGYISQYGHCSSLAVKEGDRVTKGEKIACAGNTGRSTGTHLDFRVSYKGEYIDPTGLLKS